MDLCKFIYTKNYKQMLINIKDIPKNIKPAKILLWNQLPKTTNYIDGFPTPNTPLVNNPNKSIVTDKFLYFCNQLVLTCIKDGVGLAAPQIGVPKKVFTIKENEEEFKLYFHPEYTPDINSRIEYGYERCLSVPKKQILVPRHNLINASWYEIEEDGLIVEKEELLSGFKSIVFQHEYAHLLGKSIMDFYKK